MIDFSKITAKATVDDAIRDMVTAEHFFAGSIISMPVLYPSGASVVLEVTMQDGVFLVCDRGGGAQEAELMGAMRYFKKEAQRISEHAGIRFNGHDMFVIEVPPEALQGAMKVVANCSQEAAAQAAYKAAERTESDAKEVLFARLSSIFGKKDVSKDAEVLGASNHAWKVSVLLSGQPRLGMFEPVSNSYVSVVGTTAKFYDFANLEHPPLRIAVVKSRASIGDFFGVVSAASNRVIELSASNDQFKRLVA